MGEEYPLKDITEKIIGAAFRVHNNLGGGFHEKVYENALMDELKIAGLHAEQQRQLTVLYGGKPVGDFFADILVERSVVLELKAVRMLEMSHEQQLLQYLKSSDMEVGLLINFGPSVQIRRKINTKNK
jgi:GxxExxY protein